MAKKAILKRWKPTIKEAKFLIAGINRFWLERSDCIFTISYHFINSKMSTIFFGWINLSKKTIPKPQASAPI